MTSEIDVARQEQERYWQGKAQRLAERIHTFNGREWDVAYYPPAEEDWREWRGACYLAALHKRYMWATERETQLHLGRGPFWCKECEQKPKAGWRALLCLDCSWESYLREEAIAMGRELGKAWTKNTQDYYRQLAEKAGAA